MDRTGTIKARRGVGKTADEIFGHISQVPRMATVVSKPLDISILNK